MGVRPVCYFLEPMSNNCALQKEAPTLASRDFVFLRSLGTCSELRVWLRRIMEFSLNSRALLKNTDTTGWCKVLSTSLSFLLRKLESYV